MNVKHTLKIFFCIFCDFFLICSGHLNANVEALKYHIVSKIPHEIPAFTQGLLIEEDRLYESTGLYKQSSLRQLDILTGKILHQTILPSESFGEGIAAIRHHIIQLTWKEHVAFVYDPFTLKLAKMIPYSGEGWGLCRDENSFWMSNGSSVLTQRDPESFKILKTLQVMKEGKPVQFLNDLECVGSYLYANVFAKNWLIQINKQTGNVTGLIDLSQILSFKEKSHLNRNDVLNGIAFRTATKTFFLTGKNWPWIFEIRLETDPY